MTITLENLILLAEDQLTQYSTEALKIEKLRRNIGIAVTFVEQQQLKEQLLETLYLQVFGQKVSKKVVKHGLCLSGGLVV